MIYVFIIMCYLHTFVVFVLVFFMLEVRNDVQQLVWQICDRPGNSTTVSYTSPYFPAHTYPSKKGIGPKSVLRFTENILKFPTIFYHQPAR